MVSTDLWSQEPGRKQDMVPTPSLSTEEYSLPELEKKQKEGWRKAMPPCLETQALAPLVVKPYPVCCQPGGILIRQIGKRRLSLRVLQICMTLGIIESKDREIISHLEPLQSLLSPTGSMPNELSIKKLVSCKVPI